MVMKGAADSHHNSNASSTIIDRTKKQA